MTDAPRLSRPVGIALSALFAYTFYASFSALIIVGLLPWPGEIPGVVAPALYVAFALSLLAGSRLYALRTGRLASFARLALSLPLFAAAAVLFTATSETYGVYLLFAYYPLFLWIGLIALPTWLVVVLRGPATR